MKKMATLWVCFTLSTLCIAQKNESFLTDAYVVKGAWLLGGDLTSSWKSYSQNQGAVKNVDKGRIFQINGAGKFGYFLFEDFALGLKATVSHFNLKSDSTAGAPTNTVVLAGPFIRKYLKDGVFGEASAGFGLDHYVDGGQSDLLAADLGIGYTYFLNKNIAIEPILALVYSRQKYGSASDLSYTEIGPEFRIGIQAFLFKPKLSPPENKR
jgi:hypothetical protein